MHSYHEATMRLLCSRHLLPVLGLVLLNIGCSEDPCAEAVSPAADGVGGPATFVARVTHQAGTPGRKNEPMTCVSVVVIAAQAYADTLAHAHLDARSGEIRIAALPADTVDILVDRAGYFPVKLTQVALTAGSIVWEDRLLMYPSRAPIILPGQLAFTLKPGASLAHVAPIYRYYDDVRISRAPGSYDLKIAWRGRETRTFTETLCRRLAQSPYVKNVRPLARLTSVIPGL